MNVAWTFVLCLALLAISSCAIQERNRDPFGLHAFYNQEIIKFEEDSKTLGQEYLNWSAKVKNWKQKEYYFLNSLSNEELQAYSELKDTYNQNKLPKHLIALRKFMALLDESGDINKLVTFKWLIREGEELIKQSAMLDSKWEKLEKRQKELAQQLSALKEMERKVEEERRYREMLSAIKGIGSGLDNLRFGLDQWRMQQWLQQK